MCNQTHSGDQNILQLNQANAAKSTVHLQPALCDRQCDFVSNHNNLKKTSFDSIHVNFGDLLSNTQKTSKFQIMIWSSLRIENEADLRY